MKLVKTLILCSLIGWTSSTNAQWTACTNPSGALPFSLEIYNDTIFLGTVSSGIYKSVDNGNSWTAINTSLNITQIWTINHANNAVFASSTSGMLYKSTNGGNNWSLSNTGISATTVVKKVIQFNGKIFATTSNTGVIISNDNGSTWAQHNTGISGLVSDAILVIENELYVGVNQRLYKYDTTSQSWTSKSTGIPNNNISTIAYTKDNLGSTTFFVGNGNSNDVAKSTNGGTNWSVADNGLPNVGVYSLLGIGTTVFAGNDYGVYKTTDYGANWTDISSFTNASQAKFLSKSTNDIFVLQGGKLWKKSLSSLGLSASEVNIQDENFTIYPNPVINNLLINSKYQFSKYEITDISGQKLAIGIINNQLIDMSTLKPGVYILKLITFDNKTINKRVLKK